MYEDETTMLKDYADRLAELRKCLNVDATKADIATIEREMTASNFWDDPESAQKVMQRLKLLKSFIAAPDELQREIEDGSVLVELAQGEADESMSKELGDLANTLGEKLDRLEITSLFTDPRDSKSAIVNIHPGAGGTES